MTIRIIRTATLGLPVGAIRTFTATVEAALVADKEAVYHTNPPETSGIAPVTADAAGNLYANGQPFQASVSGPGISVDPAVRASRGYVVAADLRAANIAGSANCTVTDVERVAPDGTKLRGIRMTANAGTACTVDLTIRSATFPTGRVSTLIYSDPAAAGGLDPTITFWVADGAGFTQAFNRNGVVLSAKGWAQIAPGDAAGNSANKWAAGAGTPAWGSTAFTRLRYTLSYSAAQTPWIEIYEVSYNEDAPKSWIGISIDDGYDSAYTLGAPALER